MASSPEHIRRLERIDYKLGFAEENYPHLFPLKHGQKLQACGSFDGWSKIHAMTVSGGDCTFTTKLGVGESYEWQARIVDSFGNVVEYLPGPNKKFTEGPIEKQKKRFEVIRNGIAVETSHDKEDVHKVIRGTAKEVLKAITTYGDASGAEALIEAKIIQKEGVLGIPEEIKADVLTLLPEVIREEKTLPAAIRSQFPKGLVLRNFDEVRDRMKNGALLFRRAVFSRIKGNKDARERFKIRPTAPYNPNNPLGNKKLNELFNRVCNEHDRGELSEYYARAMEGFAESSTVDPKLVSERQAILDSALSRIDPQVVKKFARRFSTKKPKVTELGGQALVGFASLATPLALLALPTKWLAEVGLGVSITDAMRAKNADEFKELVKNNNILSRWWNTEDSLWKLVKERMALSIKKSIPLYGAMKYGADTTAEWPAGEKEIKGDLADHEKLVRKACDQAMNEESLTSAAAA